MKTNFHNYAEEYFKHRNDIPSAFFEELTKRNIELSGSKVADIGAGPGFVSKVLSEHGAIVDAVEPSEEFIKIGKKYVSDDDRISFTKGTAEHTGLMTILMILSLSCEPGTGLKVIKLQKK